MLGEDETRSGHSISLRFFAANFQSRLRTVVHGDDRACLLGHVRLLL